MDIIGLLVVTGLPVDLATDLKHPSFTQVLRSTGEGTAIVSSDRVLIIPKKVNRGLSWFTQPVCTVTYQSTKC